MSPPSPAPRVHFLSLDRPLRGAHTVCPSVSGGSHPARRLQDPSMLWPMSQPHSCPGQVTLWHGDHSLCVSLRTPGLSPSFGGHDSRAVTIWVSGAISNRCPSSVSLTGPSLGPRWALQSPRGQHGVGGCVRRLCPSGAGLSQAALMPAGAGLSPVTLVRACGPGKTPASGPHRGGPQPRSPDGE